jgi:hypothetical protein
MSHLSDLSHFVVPMKPNAVAGERNLGSYRIGLYVNNYLKW